MRQRCSRMIIHIVTKEKYVKEKSLWKFSQILESYLHLLYLFLDVRGSWRCEWQKRDACRPRFREGRKRVYIRLSFKFLVQPPSRWCNLPPRARGGSSLLPLFFLSTPPPPLPLFIPFLPAHRCNLWTGSGRRRDRREGRERIR